MKSQKRHIPDDMWAYHNEQLRDPAEIVSFWRGVGALNPELLNCEVRGDWWGLLEELKVTLLVTREYEHLLLAMNSAKEEEKRFSYMLIPHPSGIAFDPDQEVLYVASTRNPNQVYELKPVRSLQERLDFDPGMFDCDGNPLIPTKVRFFPGCTYLHDLVMLGGELHATSVGQNAIIKFTPGGYKRVWWPKCIEKGDGPVFGQNQLQLNSIAAGGDIEGSFFSASTDEVTSVRPGDPLFPVDRRGVIFSGKTREAIARGLTRPHSARLYKESIWVDNSGYGEVGFIKDGGFRPVASLAGWTRGLCFKQNIMFVGTSRVLPRFYRYAPGLDVSTSRCGIYAIDTGSGETVASIAWPLGNQIFAIECVPENITRSLPFRQGDEAMGERERSLFYAFQLEKQM